MIKESKTAQGGAGDDGLTDKGLAEIKRQIANQLTTAMKKDGISKVEMARRMNTSRGSLDRLLDPENSSVTLHTMHRACAVIGRTLEIKIAHGA